MPNCAKLCILDTAHQLDSLVARQCMKKFTENSNFAILLCKTPLYRCKSSCTEVLKWLFLVSIHLMCKSQLSWTKLNVVFFKIHRNFQKTKIWSEMVQFEPSKVSNLGFLKISVYFEKDHIEFGTRKLTFAHQKMYGNKKQSFQVLCTPKFVPEKWCFA